MEIKEGYMPFMGYQTYYRIVGKTEEPKKFITSESLGFFMPLPLGEGI